VLQDTLPADEVVLLLKSHLELGGEKAKSRETGVPAAKCAHRGRHAGRRPAPSPAAPSRPAGASAPAPSASSMGSGGGCASASSSVSPLAAALAARCCRCCAWNEILRGRVGKCTMLAWYYLSLAHITGPMQHMLGAGVAIQSMLYSRWACQIWHVCFQAHYAIANMHSRLMPCSSAQQTAG